MIGWLVVFGLTALLDSISVFIGPFLREREKEKRNDSRREKKMSKQPLSAHTASAVGPCPSLIQISRTPGTVSLLSTIAPSDHPFSPFESLFDFDVYVSEL